MANDVEDVPKFQVLPCVIIVGRSIQT